MTSAKSEITIRGWPRLRAIATDIAWAGAAQCCPRRLNLLSQDIAAGTASVVTLDRKGAVTLQSPPLPSLASVAPYRTKKGRDIGHLNRSARLKVAKQIGLYVSHQTISLPQALYGRNLHHAQHWMRPRYARLAFRSRSSRLLCALGLIDGWLSKSPRSSR